MINLTGNFGEEAVGGDVVDAHLRIGELGYFYSLIRMVDSVLFVHYLVHYFLLVPGTLDGAVGGEGD